MKTDDFFKAIKEGNVAGVRKALAQGADLNARHVMSVPNVRYEVGGATPLHLAAWKNPEPSIIKVLLDGGADVNARDEEGWTPLHMAASFNSEPSIINALLDGGADASLHNKEDRTPLHCVRKENYKGLYNTDAYWRLNDAYWRVNEWRIEGYFRY